jgi:hypothetical protein
MSNITTAYDDITAVITTILPNHNELINPYVIELNDDLTFDKAWGLAIADGENTNLQLGCRLSVDRNFRFTLTRKIFAGQLQRNLSAVTARRDTEKQLFEDQYLVLKELETNPTITDSTVITKLVWSNDNGLELLRTEKSDIIFLTTVLKLTYLEEL